MAETGGGVNFGKGVLLLFYSIGTVIYRFSKPEFRRK